MNQDPNIPIADSPEQRAQRDRLSAAVAVGDQNPPARPPTAVAEWPLMPPLARGEREPLPMRRAGKTIKVRIGDMSAPPLYLRTGEYPDGRLGEIFLSQAKTGTYSRSVLEGFAKLFSIALQYGTPFHELVEAYKHTNFEPNGWCDDPEVQDVSSVFDYIVRRLELDYPNQR